jgi:hypothetical protein
MTTQSTEPAATSQGLSAAAFLFATGADGQDSIQQIAAALKETGVLGSVTEGLTKLSKAGVDAVGNQLAGITNALLDIGLDTLILEGWRKFDDLHAAARRTTEASGSSEVLDLASHSISTAHEPRVELQVDGVPLATLSFALSLTFELKAAVATVRDGRLVSLHSGVCDVEGSLEAGGKQLASRSGHFQLPLLVPLGSGVPLLTGGRGTSVNPTSSSTSTSSTAPADLPAEGASSAAASDAGSPMQAPSGS